MPKWKLGILLLSLTVYFSAASTTFAQEHSSDNYGIDEFFIGSGGEVDATSDSFRLRGAVGEIGIGNAASGSYQLYGGFQTTDEEHLELTVTGTTIDLGVLDIGSASTGTANFSVRNYLTHGYVVQTIGDAPTNAAGDVLDPMTTATTSSPGTEQFGMNLVANTSPSTFGADPVQVPSASYSYGDASAGYDSANNYQYNNGDTIAESPQSTGQTDYTISYLANVASFTPSGVYTMQQAIVVTTTY